MYIIGITGPSGAGKSIAMQAAGSIGAVTLDCDEIYHGLISDNTDMADALKERFPNAVTGNAIDRSRLADIVFKDKAELEDLEKITHKHIINKINEEIEKHKDTGGEIAAIDAISLIESGYSEKCDLVISVIAPVEDRISRIIKRDNITEEKARERINAQKPDEFYKTNSDAVLLNKYKDPADFQELCRKTILIAKWFSVHKDELLGDLEKLVAINSVNGINEPGAPCGRAPREALRLAQDMLERRGFDVDVFKDMVITARYGPAPAELAVLTHLDIVEAGEHWDTDPFKLTNIDGRLFGRGVMDNKGPAVASMYALYCIRDLFPNLQHGFELIFGSCEEVGFDDIAQYIKHNKMPPNVFSPDSEFPVVNIEKGRFMPYFCAKWEKDQTAPRIASIQGGKTPNIVPNKATATVEGIASEDAERFCRDFSGKTGVEIKAEASGENTIAITAKGTAAHASRPHLGNNAQAALVEMLAAMPFAESASFNAVRALSRLFPHGDHYGRAIGLNFEDELSGKTTVNFGVLRLDEHGMEAALDARTALCADKTDILKLTRDVLEKEGFSITKHEIKQGHHTPEDTPFVKSLIDTYEMYTGKSGECLCVGGLTYVHDIPGAVAYGCTMSDDDNNVHGPNEYIDVNHLLKCAMIFTQVILEVCGGANEN